MLVTYLTNGTNKSTEVQCLSVLRNDRRYIALTPPPPPRANRRKHQHSTIIHTTIFIVQKRVPGHPFPLELSLRRRDFAVQAHLVENFCHGAPDVQLLLRLLHRHLCVRPAVGWRRNRTTFTAVHAHERKRGPLLQHNIGRKAQWVSFGSYSTPPTAMTQYL